VKALEKEANEVIQAAGEREFSMVNMKDINTLASKVKRTLQLGNQMLATMSRV